MLEFQLRNCKGDIGFLIEGSDSVTIGSGGWTRVPPFLEYAFINDLEYNWDLILNFIIALANNTGISQNGTRMAVVVFSETAKLEIKFSDHQSYESFESSVLAIEYPKTIFANSLKGFDVALNEMFDESTGMRPNPIPKTLIYLSDGQCRTNDCDPSLSNIPDACKREEQCAPDQCESYRNCQEKRFAEWGTRFDSRNIRKIGIRWNGFGIGKIGGLGENINEIVDFVGKQNFFPADSFNEILTKQFRRSLSICEGKYYLLPK